jgi:hypothetical protein
MIYPSGISEIADQLDGSTIQGAARASLLSKLRRELLRVQYRARVRHRASKSRV